MSNVIFNALADARDPSVILALEYIGKANFYRAPGDVEVFEIFVSNDEDVSYDGGDVRKAEPKEDGNYFARYANHEVPEWESLDPSEWKLGEYVEPVLLRDKIGFDPGEYDFY